MVAECEYPFKQVGIVGDEHPTFTRGDRFSAVKREGSKPAHRTGTLAVIHRTYRFGSIFDHGDTVFFANRQ